MIEVERYRVISLGEFGVMVGVCRKCGALVADTDQHDAFHLALSVAYEHGYTCHLCGVLIDVSIVGPHPEALTMDHLIPVSEGGTDERINLRPAHMRCNSARGNRPLLEAV